VTARRRRARLPRIRRPGRAERQARAALGMPARHPERITGDLPAGQEEYLSALASALWPEDEYAAIIAELWRGGQP